MKLFVALVAAAAAFVIGIAIVAGGPDGGTPSVHARAHTKFRHTCYPSTSTRRRPAGVAVAGPRRDRFPRITETATDGSIRSTGNVAPPILGPPLDGTNGNARIPDPSFADGWAHAMGPMQFIPSTWTRWGGSHRTVRPVRRRSAKTRGTRSTRPPPTLCGGHPRR